KIAAAFATAAQTRLCAPARTAPSMSETSAARAAWSTPHAPAHPPVPACHSPSLHRLAGQALPLLSYLPLSAASRAAPISPVSSPPAAVKFQPSPAPRAAPVPRSPDTHASAVPRASSAAPSPPSSASPRLFLSFSSLRALCVLCVKTTVQHFLRDCALSHLFL